MNAYQPRETRTSGYDNTCLSFDPAGTLIFGYDALANWFTALNVEASPGTAARVRQCTGKERDAESQLDYFGARYYGSALGRFTSPDETLIDQDPHDPQSWNLYGYVRNNPLKNIDPFGEDCITTSNQTSSGVTVTTERGGSAQTCSGSYVDGTVNTNSYQYNGTNLAYSFANNTASGAGNIQFATSLDSDALAPDVARTLRDAGDRAAPFVNAAGEGLKLFGYLVAAPFMAAADCAAKGKDCSATCTAMAMVPGGGEEETAAQIIARSRAGKVLREFPGEYLNSTLKDIQKDAKAGVQAARKALKLLKDTRDKFQK